VKICKKCNTEKLKNEFSKDSSKNDGLCSSCKLCAKITHARWVSSNKERVMDYGAKYRANNSESIKNAKAIYYASNKEKEKTRSSKWYSDNIEKAKVRAAKYYADNTNALSERAAKYYAANQVRIRISVSKWRKENQDAKRIHEQNRRARKLSSGGKLSVGLFKRLFILQRGRCPVCKAALSNENPRSPMDHIIALANGGKNEDSNIQLLCQPCNNQKHAKDPIDFMQSRGFLL